MAYGPNVMAHLVLEGLKGLVYSTKERLAQTLTAVLARGSLKRFLDPTPYPIRSPVL